MEKILETYTVKQLKDFARKYKVRGFSTKRKAELIFMLKDNPNLKRLNMSLTYNLKKGNTYDKGDRDYQSSIRRMQHGIDKLTKISKGTYKQYEPKKTVYMTKKRKAAIQAKKRDKELFLNFAELIGKPDVQKKYFVPQRVLKMIDTIKTKVKNGSYEIESFSREQVKNKKLVVLVKVKGGSRPFKFTLRMK